jgi:general secretion pathway protein D
MEPSNATYWLRGQALQEQAVQMAKPKPSVRENRNTALGSEQFTTEPSERITEAELEQARQGRSLIDLNGSGIRKDLNLRGNATALFQQVANAYGLSAVFDPDYKPVTSIRFQLEDADYRLALRALGTVTDSFIVPLSEHRFLVANDTPQKRVELEPTVSVTIPIPEPVTAQEAQELVRAVQQAMALQRLTFDSQRRMALIRDRASKVRPAQELFLDLLRFPGQVSIEVQILEARRTRSTTYGASLQTLFPLVNFSDFLNSTPSIPSGFTHFAVFGGGATFFGIGVTNAQVFARMSRSNSRNLLKTEIRSLDGQAASIHVGDRFPIVTSAFIGQTQGEQVSVPPAFTFEDLGLVLKVTPHLHGIEDVTLDVEAELKVLTGESVNSIPIISNRRLQSTVRLRNGEWAVIAGLMTTSEAKTITGPAGLSSLPVIGPLVRKNDRNEDRDDILVVIKPAILSLPPNQAPTRTVWLGSETKPLAPL